MLASSGADLQLRALNASVLVKGREMGLGRSLTLCAFAPQPSSGCLWEFNTFLVAVLQFCSLESVGSDGTPVRPIKTSDTK